MPQQGTNAEIALLIAAKIAQEVERSAGKGLDAARVFLTNRIREAVSIPAPRRTAIGRDGIRYYVAATPATPGAPPRKLSGKLRQSIWSRMISPTQAIIGVNARSSEGFNYPRFLETNTRVPHPFIRPTVEKYRSELASIVGRELRLRFGTR